LRHSTHPRGNRPVYADPASIASILIQPLEAAFGYKVFSIFEARFRYVRKKGGAKSDRMKGLYTGGSK
jgi:hypothetical protein